MIMNLTNGFRFSELSPLFLCEDKGGGAVVNLKSIKSQIKSASPKIGGEDDYK